MTTAGGAFVGAALATMPPEVETDAAVALSGVMPVPLLTFGPLSLVRLISASEACGVVSPTSSLMVEDRLGAAKTGGRTAAIGVREQ